MSVINQGFVTVWLQFDARLPRLLHGHNSVTFPSFRAVVLLLDHELCSRK